MFNDFKILVFDKVKHKLQKLKDIFDRLRLSPLEERLNKLSLNFDFIFTKIIQVSEQIEKLEEEKLFPPEPPIPPEPEELPDLAIIKIIPTDYGDYTNFEITLKNIGLSFSPATVLKSVIPDVLNRDIPIPSLEPNDEFVTNTQHSYDPDGDEINTSFLVDVNPNRIFNEVTYANNRSSIPVTIKSQRPPDNETYVILHIHNPEGKELAWAGNIDSNLPFGIDVTYFINDIRVTLPFIPRHNWRIPFNYFKSVISGEPFPPGIYNFKIITNYDSNDLCPTFQEMQQNNAPFIVVDNGMIEIKYNTTTEIVFTVPRTIANINFSAEGSATLNDWQLKDYWYETSKSDTGLVKCYGRSYDGDENGEIRLAYNISSYFNSWNMYVKSPLNPNMFDVRGYFYVDTNISVPCNIPKQSFKNWYIQNITSGYYMQIFIAHEDEEEINDFEIVRPRIIDDINIYPYPSYPPDSPDPDHHIFLFPAKHDYLKLYFYPPIAGWEGDKFIIDAVPGTEVERILSGTLDYKLSSVPYAMNSLAF